MLEQFSCDNSGFTDLLVDVAEVLCRSDKEMEYLADYYKEHQQDVAALEIVLKGLEECEGRLDGIYQYLFIHNEKNGEKKSIEHLLLTAKKKK